MPKTASPPPGIRFAVMPASEPSSDCQSAHGAVGVGFQVCQTVASSPTAKSAGAPSGRRAAICSRRSTRSEHRDPVVEADPSDHRSVMHQAPPGGPGVRPTPPQTIRPALDGHDLVRRPQGVHAVGGDGDLTGFHARSSRGVGRCDGHVPRGRSSAAGACRPGRRPVWGALSVSEGAGWREGGESPARLPGPSGAAVHARAASVRRYCLQDVLECALARAETSAMALLMSERP